MVNETDVQKSTQEMFDSFRVGIQETQKNVDLAIVVLNEYVQNERQRNDVLSKNINSCNAVFEKLTASGERVLQNTKSLQKKLDASCTALSVIENQKEILNEIFGNFAAVFDGRSVEIQKQLQRILDRLTSISHSCDHFKTFPKPYKDMIDLYNVKIEQIFGVLPVASAPEWEYHYKTGIACVFIAPERAFMELSKAIELNPGNAEQYYFRGMALKKLNYKYLALGDFEKACQLSPNMDEYKNAAEEVRSSDKEQK